MNATLLTVLLTAAATGTHAQPSFMKMFNATGTGQADLNAMSSGNMRIGMARQSGTSLFDPSGDIIQSRNYKVDTMLVLQSIKKYTDNEFYFTATYWKDTCSETGSRMMYPMIGRTDSLGDITTVRHYNLTAPQCANGGGKIEVMNDGGAIAIGTDTWFYAVRADHALAPVWAKRFSNRGSFQFIKELPNGDLLAGINMDTAGAVVARMDANGNFLWCKSYIRPRGMVHDAVTEPDGSFVITGFTDSTASTNPFIPYPLNYHPKLFIMKLNGQGEVQWCKGFDSAPNLWYARSASRIVRTMDGNYAVLANTGYPQNLLWYRPLLMKTDQNGDTLWTRSYGRFNYDYKTINLLAYSDGGFIFNGRIWGTMPDGTNNNWAFLYKTDSLGHLPCYEHYYPVQVSDLFPIDSSFTLTSIDGAEARPAFISDTAYAPIITYNGCTVTNSLPLSYSRNRSITIRPNPNTGRFTMKFPDPLMAESYYGVYDVMGRLLYQRPLPMGKQTEEIDLTCFGAGTYVLKLTDLEGACFERVVVE